MSSSIQNSYNQSIISSYKTDYNTQKTTGNYFENLLSTSGTEVNKPVTTKSAKNTDQKTNASILFINTHAILFSHTDGTTTTFPPIAAPESVKQAWKSATANLNEMDVATMAMSFQPPSKENSIDSSCLPANVATKTSEYTLLTDTASYIAKTKEVIDGSKFSSKFAQPWQIDTWKNQISALENFLSNLKQNS
jgi:hypothetical protein